MSTAPAAAVEAVTEPLSGAQADAVAAELVDIASKVYDVAADPGTGNIGDRMGQIGYQLETLARHVAVRAVVVPTPAPAEPAAAPTTVATPLDVVNTAPASEEPPNPAIAQAVAPGVYMPPGGGGSVTFTQDPQTGEWRETQRTPAQPSGAVQDPTTVAPPVGVVAQAVDNAATPAAAVSP